MAPLPEAQPRPASAIPATPTASAGFGYPGGFAAYRNRLGALARSAGVREATIQAVVPTLQLNSRVIQLDRGQPGQVGNPNSTPPFAPYRREHVTADLISRGQARYSALWPQLSRIQTRYGVEPQVLMAIFGHETSYGRVTGGFDLLQSLASLAYDGRRRGFFEDEFVAAMRLLDQGVARDRLKGSWAGATGYPQFMPTIVQRLRVDGDGDGYANIWTNEADALASIANYFRDAGWKPNVHWGVAARVPAGFNRSAVATRLKSPRCERVYARHSRWMTMREWRALGVVPTGRTLPDSEMASLIEPDGPGSTAYLLSQNYRVILDYNCSNFYALSVGLLADAIARG
ncbi:lytic murein transglycosylase [Sphingomonas ginkgonis]|uniref:Lytic murein transglycosylase n=1 Tax=Sphingomonas ginkgonis TaxID=2315330 RepID=A0A3R9YL02_9SPHN|nr:lytic murein transglycosylase [Sphingomonas ginkgonis]